MGYNNDQDYVEEIGCAIFLLIVPISVIASMIW